MTDAFYDGLPTDAIEAAMEIRTCTPGEQLEPVELVLTRECRYKAKACGACGKPKSNTIHRKKNQQEGKPYCAFKRKLGCASCGRAKYDPVHVGAPDSFNVFASGGWEAYQSAKKRWHSALKPLLEASGLPKGLGRVLVEGSCSFGDDTERDQGNHRVVVEKALGDVLVDLGYLPGDKWHQYEFGGLQRREEDGVNRLRLMIFPEAPAPSVPDNEPPASTLFACAVA